MRKFPLLLLALLPLRASAQLNATQKEDIGLTSLAGELGAGLPTGAGLSVSQVEAPDGSGNYRANPALFTDKAFVFPSGGSTTPSGHANTVGRYLYGPDSPAPAAGRTVNSDTVAGYEASDWIGSGFLKNGNASLLPEVETRDVQNHSWIGTMGDPAIDIEIIRRADYAITRDDFVMVAGLNNGTGTPPNLMSGAYNGITVGVSSGNHSWGTTSIDGSGRIRPDIVAPTSATSWSTAVVSGAAAMLQEAALSSPALAEAARHETVKALLLNGATKDESEFGGMWNRTPEVPLDTVYGAGELNVHRSYSNLLAGQQAAADDSLLGINGWDYGTASSTLDQAYFFEIPDGYTSTLTATLIWDRIVTATDGQPGPQFSYSFSSLLADLNLHLFSSSGFALDTLVDESISAVDPLEHLFNTELAAGTYAMVVSADAAGEGRGYGLAWSNELVEVVPEPGLAVLFCGGMLVFLRRRRL